MPRTRSSTAITRRGVVDGDGTEPAWSIPSLREPRYSQSLERGLAILGCFTPERPVLGIADIADELGMSRSTTHRYVITLVALGFLEQGASRKYRLGLRVTDLGMSAMNATGLREHARPHLEELRQLTSYTASLGVLDGTEVVWVEVARSLRRQRSAPGPAVHAGSRTPSWCSAAGKVLLAYLPEEEERQALAEIKLSKCGPKTVTSKRALKEQLERVRRDGLATENEELAAGLVAIAAPVLDQSGDVTAALALSAPSALISLRQMTDALAPYVVSTAARISARLGYRRADERD